MRPSIYQTVKRGYNPCRPPMSLTIKTSIFTKAVFIALGLLVVAFVAFELWAAITAPLRFRLPVPSLDGGEFAYFNPIKRGGSEGAPRYDLILATPDGQLLARFSTDPGTLLWSNAGHLAIHRRDRNEVTIIVNAGNRYVVLTSIDLLQGSEPRWSRDGNKLACLRPPGAAEAILIYDTQQPSAIPALPADVRTLNPALISWSPGSSSLFFVNQEGNEWVLNRLEIAETTIHTLARGLAVGDAGNTNLPRVSPDGTKIYLLPPQSVVVDAHTGDRLWELPKNAAPLWSSWSGDGGRFFYVRANEPKVIYARDFVTASDSIIASGVQSNGIFSIDGDSYSFRSFAGPAITVPAIGWHAWLDKSWGWQQVDLANNTSRDLGRLELWPWELDLSGRVLAREDRYTRVRYGLYDPEAPGLTEFRFPTARQDLLDQIDSENLYVLVVAIYLVVAFVSLVKRGESASVRAYYLLGLLLATILAHQSVLDSAVYLDLSSPYRVGAAEVQGLGWWPRHVTTQALFEYRLLIQNALWALIPLVLLHFAVVFPDQNRFLAARKVLWPFLYAVALVPFAGVVLTREAFGPQRAILVRLAMLCGPLVLAALAVSLARSYSHPPSRRARDQIRWVAVAFALMAAGGAMLLLLHGLVPRLSPSGVPRFVDVLRSAILVGFGMMATVAVGYALVAAKPYDIHLFVRRFIRYSLMAVPVGGLFVAAMAGLSWVATGSPTSPNASIVVGAALLTGLVTVAARHRLRSFVERIYERSELEWREALESFAKGVPHILDRTTLAVRLGTTLQKTLGSRRVYLFALDRQARKFKLNPPKGAQRREASDVEFEIGEPLSLFLLGEQPFEVEVSPYSSELIPVFQSAAERLAKLDAAVVFGLKRRDELLGLLVLGNKSTDEFYNAEELDLLTAIAAQTAQALENLELFETVARNYEQRKEIEDASELQAQLQPRAVPQISGAQLAGQCLPARSISGDYYDFLELPRGKVGLVIGDVSGRGMHASLLMANIVDLMRTHASGAESPAELVRKVNQQIYGPVRGSGLCSMFYGIYDPATQRLEFVNAGHSPPLLLTARGPRFFESTGLPMGIFPVVTHDTRIESLGPDATLVLYSDGITEARNVSGEFYGLDRLVDVVSLNQDLDASRLIARILQDVGEFTADAPIEDDQTLVLLRMNPD